MKRLFSSASANKPGCHRPQPDASRSVMKPADDFTYRKYSSEKELSSLGSKALEDQFHKSLTFGD